MTKEASPLMEACSDAVSKAVLGLIMEHDARLLFACLLAESAHLGAVLREAKIYTPLAVARSFAEGIATAMTYQSQKPPHIMYTDGETPVGSKQ